MGRKNRRSRRDTQFTNPHIGLHRPATSRKSPFVTSLLDNKNYHRSYFPFGEKRSLPLFVQSVRHVLRGEPYRKVKQQLRQNIIPDQFREAQVHAIGLANKVKDPLQTVCAKRQMRREVLHALGITGGRGGALAPPTYKTTSSIICKRRK